MAQAADSVVIIGAGPAGLTAAYELARPAPPVTVLEADPDYVGGIARTAKHKGYHFDIGGHRFFSKTQEVEDLWTEILPDDMLHATPALADLLPRPVLRLPAQGRRGALCKLGVARGACAASLSYAAGAAAHPITEPAQLRGLGPQPVRLAPVQHLLQDLHREGVGHELQGDLRRLGRPAHQGPVAETPILQRAAAEAEAQAQTGEIVKTLIDSLPLPAAGPGHDVGGVAAELAESMGTPVLMGRKVVRLRTGSRARPLGGHRETRTAAWSRHAGSARHLVSADPPAGRTASTPPRAGRGARGGRQRSRYRDFLTVVLIDRRRRRLPRQLDLHPRPRASRSGRIQNFKSWCPEMVPDPSMTCYGLEYFCFEGDGLWTSRDADLDRAGDAGSWRSSGLARRDEVVDGCVVRQPKAYPVYDDDYASTCDVDPRRAGRRNLRTCTWSAATACTSTTTRTTR